MSTHNERQNKQVIIFGSNGMLGRYLSVFLKQQNYTVIDITRQEFDIIRCYETLTESINDLLTKYSIDKNTIVINCIGLIPQTRNNDEIDYIKINSVFPVQLSHICMKYNAKLIHPTTDCVFNGSKGCYDEMHHRDETNMYGTSKILGESIHATVIRTSIIGEERYNKRSLLEWAISNNNNIVKGYTTHIWNGITCLEFAKIVDFIITNNLYWTGIRHLFSQECVSKHKLLHMISEVYKLNIQIEQYITKNINKTLTTIYTDTLQNYTIPSLYDQLVELKRFDIYS